MLDATTTPGGSISRQFTLRVRGNSMTCTSSRTYPDGAIILVDTDKKAPVSGDRVIARLERSNEATFRIFMEEGDRRWLAPLNSDGYQPVFEPFEVVGTVIGKWAD